MSKNNPVSRERLMQVLRFDHDAGVFFWRVDRRPGFGTRNAAGSVAGTVKDKGSSYGYLVIWLDGRLYRAHRLAWLYVYGNWPVIGVDHINGDPMDNRIANLRECTQQQNNGNTRLNRTNTSGFRGVTWKKDRRKWKAFINIDDRQTHLGYFLTAEEAYQVYCDAARKHFGEFARV